ncbi:histidine phosphatase family protein [Cytobacillus gottheilii]|uniref:histidine phosphatase family protein n=1 Tax=Cytobacillus gottheilii TaxID=859144 RepID=UPI0031F1747E
MYEEDNKLELVFIRHGQGEHTLNLPYSLYTTDTSLTKEGIIQARELRTQFPISEDDIVIISPIL